MIKWQELEGYLNDNNHNNQEPGCVIEHVLSGSILVVFKMADNELFMFRRGIKPLRQFPVYDPSDDIIILKGNVYDV